MSATDIQLRWVVYRNPMVNAARVREFAREANVSLMAAKVALLDETKPVLQYRDGSFEWRDVPTVIIER